MQKRLRQADTIWHLREGELAEVGPPELLLKGGGPTAALFRPALIVNATRDARCLGGQS